MTDMNHDSGGEGWVATVFALLFAILMTIVLVGCSVGPDYERPAIDLPERYAAAQSAAPAPARWWTVFGDETLERLVTEALAANRDLRAAAARVEQSRAQLRITRADQLPSAGVEGNVNRTRASSVGAVQIPSEFVETNDHRLVLRLAWELDFWGKYRRASEAARADLLASEAGRDAVRNSLVGDVVRGYFALRALDRRSAIIDRTLLGRQKALELQKLRWDSGMVSELEYRQVESDLRSTAALAPTLRQARGVQESALAVLLGRSPREIFDARIDAASESAPAAVPEVEVPAGLPSELLLLRPDLRQAEAHLVAANARIGVARAAYFPSISLTGFYGGESQKLGDLFTGPARTWSVGADLLQPLFAAGQIEGGVNLADARTREAAELYRKAVATGFKEVRDAIAAQTNLREAMLAQQQRVQALARTLELAHLRYDNGAVSLFEVLDAERQLLEARQDAVNAERDRRDAIVDLYLALGA